MQRMTAWHAVLSISLVAVSWVFQPSRGVKPVTVPERIRRAAGFDGSQSAALFVGVSTFEDERFASVPFGVDDAVDLAHLFAIELELVLPQRTVLCLSGEPHKLDSRERLGALLEAGASRVPADQSEIYSRLASQASATADKGVFLVSFATHGFADEGSDFLVASDTLRRFVKRTGIHVADVFDEVALAKAPRRIVLLDACRERLSSETRAGSPDRESRMSQAFVDAIGAASGQAVLSATTLGGYSYDDHSRKNGVFTAAIRDGLMGQAPVDKDIGFVTLRTLAEYVNERVESWIDDNRSNDANRGIETRFDSRADRMPLAANPAVAAYNSRLQNALEELRSNIGAQISGSMHDQIVTVLSSTAPDEARLALLDELEALDGSARSQRILADYFNRRRHEFDPALSDGRGSPFDPGGEASIGVKSGALSIEILDPEVRGRIVPFSAGQTEQTIIGRVQPAFQVKHFTINDERVDFNQDSGFFSARVAVSPGGTEVTIVALNEVGDGSIRTLTFMPDVRSATDPSRAEPLVGLIVAQLPGCTSDEIGGCDDVWSEDQKKSLTYCVSSDFRGNHQAVVRDMDNASKAWEAAADIDFIHDKSQDDECQASNDKVVFDVSPTDHGEFLVSGFFPHEPRSRRSLRIDQSALDLDPNGKLQLVGGLRQTLGKVLGFRHEHTRPEAGVCFEDYDWRALSEDGYNPYSVMHFPQCNGLGDWSLTLTQSDKNGVACLYGPAEGLSFDVGICAAN